MRSNMLYYRNLSVLIEESFRDLASNIKVTGSLWVYLTLISDYINKYILYDYMNKSLNI